MLKPKQKKCIEMLVCGAYSQVQIAREIKISEQTICNWKKDDEFKPKFKAAKGFCTPHYSLLLKKSVEHLKGSELEEFVQLINEMYITNMERVRDDVAWFINKFDYKYQDEPWYNAKDSVIRSLVKASSVILEE